LIGSNLNPDRLYLDFDPSYIKVDSDVTQGGVLSPFLFITALDWILYKCNAAVNLIRNKQLFAFADDILILNNNCTIETVRLVEQLSDYGLKVNRDKCFYIGNKCRNLDRIATKQNKISYLGTIICK
jgi:hypothetical protein